MTGNPLELFRKFFGAVRMIFWLCGSFLAPDISGVRKRVISKRVVLADVPLERNRNEGTFAKTTLLQNRPFIFYLPVTFEG